jgi:2-keto-3-deoxy-L-rhamnonate aldolase RhmA
MSRRCAKASRRFSQLFKEPTMQGELFRQRLKSGQRVYITHVVSPGNPIGAALTTGLQIDAVFICTEHMPLDRGEVSMMCQFYSLHGISPMVRIPYPCPRLAAMALDGGAQGIVVPYVETVEEIKALVGAVHYRPIKGEILRGILDGSIKPNEKLQTFWNRFNRHHYLIIGIESVPAIRRLEELVTIEGVDGVFLGPHDISCSMGIPEEYDNPQFIRTVTDIIQRCRRVGVGVGIQADLAAASSKPFLDAGMNFMFHFADVVKMRETMNGEFAALRRTYGDQYDRTGSNGAAIATAEVCIDQTRES